MKKKNRMEKTLISFLEYCATHPEERFWQALRNWAEVPYIFVGDHMGSEVSGGRDTFYWEGRNK